MNNDKFYNDAENKLRDSGNHKSPSQKLLHTKKSLKKFLEKLKDENDKEGTQ